MHIKNLFQILSKIQYNIMQCFFLTRNYDSGCNVVDRRKEYFENILNPTNAHSGEKVGPMDLWTGSRISVAEVAEVFKKTSW